MFQFLWEGNLKIRKFHLYSWESLCLPKKLAGWGLKHLGWFNLDLNMKIIWRCLKGEGLWSMVIKAKYIEFCMVTQWFQKPNKYVSKASIILRKLRKDFSILSKTILWRIGTGTKMMLGIGPFIGDEGNYALSSAFISVSNRKIIMYLDTDRRTNSLGEDSSYCLSYGDLELNGDQVVEWDNYVPRLKRDGIVFNNE